MSFDLKRTFTGIREAYRCNALIPFINTWCSFGARMSRLASYEAQVRFLEYLRTILLFVGGIVWIRPTVPFLKTIIMGAKKQFKDIEVSLVDAVELRDILDDVIAEIKTLQPNTDVKVSGKITLQYYVDEDNI
jgi:hypothetical protein